MSLFAAAQCKPSSWPISVGAEGIAAAQFARCGFDVLIQAGHDKPWYDLAVTKGGNLLKVAVKATEDGRWCLVQSFIKRAAHSNGRKADAHGGIDLWLDIHGSRTIYCLVQFQGVDFNQMPRIYLATPAEIAHKMRDTTDRLGDPTLYEHYDWTSSESGYTSIEALPSSWIFSPERIRELLISQSATEFSGSAVHARHSPVDLRAKVTASALPDLSQAILSA
jgi:hypothetical protein